MQPVYAVDDGTCLGREPCDLQPRFCECVWHKGTATTRKKLPHKLNAVAAQRKERKGVPRIKLAFELDKVVHGFLHILHARARVPR